MKKIIYIIWFAPFLGLSQTSPGGVSSNLALWLKANTGVTHTGDGTFATAWNDQSPTGYHFSDIGGTPYIYRSSELNYNPTIDNPDGTNRRMHNTTSINLLTITLVSIADNLGACDGLFSERNTDDESVRVCSAGGAYWSIPGNDDDFSRGSGAGWLNGVAMINPIHGYNPHILTVEAPSLTTIANGIELGDSYKSRFWHGDIAEVIAYSSSHTTVLRNRIESYLAIKYAITLDNGGGGINGDYFAASGSNIWDASLSSSYHNDVIGIARDDSSALYQKQSHQVDDSTRIYLSTLSTLNSNNSGIFSSDEQFLLMGHNSGAMNSVGSVEYPSGLGIFSRIEREWKITNTAFNGTFSLDITLNTSPLIASDIRILVDDDGDFVSATMYNPSISVSGNTVTISGLSTTEIPANATRYLTLVSLNSTTPLPIDLLVFNATVNSKKEIKLDWQTASEINNAYFTIERSINGVNWQEVSKVNGAVNSTTLLSYSSLDQNPYSGISYYRLKQTDFDGQFEYSEIRSVNIINERDSEIEIFPNPTENEITILGDGYELDQVKIYNALGQDVTTLTNQINSGKSELILDLSELSEGLYYVKTKTTANKVYKQ